MYDFIQLFASHLQPEQVRAAERLGAEEVMVLFEGVDLPVL